MAFDEDAARTGIDPEDHPADIAAALSEIDPAEAWKLLCALPVTVQANVFGYIEPELQAETIEHMTRPQLTALITEMDADDRADVYNRLSEDQQEMILPALAHVERENIRRLAAYEEGTAGAIMTSDYATLKPELTAKEAIAQLRREAPDKETIYRTYVLKDDRELIGTVRLTDLILAPPSRTIADLMDDDPVYVNVDDDQEDVARTVAKYDILAVPVVDAQHHLLGIVTHDDAMDALEEEATEDFLRLGAHGDIDESVRSAGIFTLYRARIVWLVLLVFGNLLSGFGIAYFEDIIAAHIALIFFLPLLIASGGNAGAQAATLMVRALATGEVRSRDWGRMLGREFSGRRCAGPHHGARRFGHRRVPGRHGHRDGGGQFHDHHRAGGQPDRHEPALRAVASETGPGHRQRAAGHLHRRRHRRGDLLHHRQLRPVRVRPTPPPACRARR